MDVDAYLKECLDVAKDSGARAQEFDRLMLAGAAALLLEAWVQVEPDQREVSVLLVKARESVDAEPHWLVTLTRTQSRGSVHGTHRESMAGAIGEALQNWERVHGADS